MEDRIIAVVDYGAGNVQSVANALEAIGANARLTTDPDFIRSAAGVIVPGVGAARMAIDGAEGAAGRRVGSAATRGVVLGAPARLE